jgi:hypothetical protein
MVLLAALLEAALHEQPAPSLNRRADSDLCRHIVLRRRNSGHRQRRGAKPICGLSRIRTVLDLASDGPIAEPKSMRVATIEPALEQSLQETPAPCDNWRNGSLLCWMRAEGAMRSGQRSAKLSGCFAIDETLANLMSLDPRTDRPVLSIPLPKSVDQNPSATRQTFDWLRLNLAQAFRERDWNRE